jgi:hypothetical protein
MKLECSWCRKDLGFREPLGKAEITHGMCSSCLRLRVYPFVRHPRLSHPKHAPRPDRRPLLEK